MTEDEIDIELSKVDRSIKSKLREIDPDDPVAIAKRISIRAEREVLEASTLRGEMPNQASQRAAISALASERLLFVLLGNQQKLEARLDDLKSEILRVYLALIAVALFLLWALS